MKLTRALTAASLAIALSVLVSALAFAASADSTNAPPARTIEVAGSGESRTTPDTADLSLAIETHGATAEEAANKNAVLADKVIAALKGKLGDKGKISTGGYSLILNTISGRLARSLPSSATRRRIRSTSIPARSTLLDR